MAVQLFRITRKCFSIVTGQPVVPAAEPKIAPRSFIIEKTELSTSPSLVVKLVNDFPSKRHTPPSSSRPRELNHILPALSFLSAPVPVPLNASVGANGL